MLTNGTPEKFQKMTMKPHLMQMFSWNGVVENWSLLLVEHVPSLRNTFLSLGACIEIQASSKDHKGHVLRS
jgi:hypothetical protein